MKNIFFVVFFLCQLGVQAAPILPVNLRCEYRLNPLGIDIRIPRLSWNFQSAERNKLQSAYEIIVSDKLADIRLNKGTMWASGKVTSSKNIHVDYSGPSLKSSTRYYWKVKVYDEDGSASDWSDVAWFETGLLSSSDWKGKWIGDGSVQFERDEDFYQDDPMPLFKKEFRLSKKISSARLYISGLGYYEAYLNGKKVGDHVLDPGFTAYRKQVFYVTHDITALIKPGNNLVGIMLGNGWYNPLPLRLFGRFNLRDVQETGRPKVLAQMHLTYADGSTDIIATGADWLAAPGPIVRNNVYLGEHYDARFEKTFATKDGWKNATIVDGPSGQLSSQHLPPIRITKVLHPISIKETGKDTFIVDMGQNFAGVARIKVTGPAGTRVGLRYGEDLFKDGRLNYLTSVAGQIKEIWNLKGGPGSPKTAWQRDEYILKGKGEETWAPRFTFHGFRYIEITGWPGRPSANAIEGLRMNSDLELNGSFASSDSMFNRLHNVIQWTFLSNIFSVQSDCPAREKMGYGGDMVATAEAFLYNYDMSGFYAKAINDFANDQQPDGGITEIAPHTGIADRGYGGYSGPLGWQLAFPFLQKQLYQYYGDKRIIESYYPAFRKQMDFLQSKAVYGLFHWDISDHEALDPKPEALSASAFYYHHALLAKEFATILNIPEDTAKFGRLSRQIRNSIISKYYLPRTGRLDNGTQSAQLFSLYYNLTPDYQSSMKVLQDEFDRHNGHVSTGIFTTKMLFDVLRENDLGDLAYSIASKKDFPGWGFMIAHGATTLWETWEYPDNAPSQNHPMFGSVDEWFYKSLLGINAAAPGFEKIIVKPQPAGLTWAKGHYQSIRGTIRSEWKKENGKFELNVTIPPNTTAEVFLPSKDGQVITEGGKKLGDEIKNEGLIKGYTKLVIGSGEYRFVVAD